MNADIDAFEARNNAYFYTSQAAFDLDRNALIARGDQLDADLDALNALIDQFNLKLDELSELDAEAAALFDSINLETRTSGLA